MTREIELGSWNYEFESGQRVRVTRTIRNDGTYPGVPTGTKLVAAGSLGFVRDVGTFLQDQVIYSVHFTDQDRVVGCRSQELIDGDAAPASLGVLPDDPHAVLEVAEGHRAAMPNATLAISDEPAGGSPTGLPTGDVLAAGQVSSI